MKKIIQRRLAALPPKVALPLTHLAKIGQMQEKDIKTVLDAGDLTGNYNMLVGFASGAMGMKAQHVPVADTVAGDSMNAPPLRMLQFPYFPYIPTVVNFLSPVLLV